MRTYEVVFVTVPTMSDDDMTALVDQMKKSIESKKGRVSKVDSWGKRAMAYPIRNFKEAYYTIFTVEGGGEAISEVERRFRVTDTVIRFLSVRVDEDLKRQQKIKARREKKKTRRGKSRASAKPPVPESRSAQME